MVEYFSEISTFRRITTTTNSAYIKGNFPCVWRIISTHLQVAVDVAEHVDWRLDEEAAGFVLEDGSRSRAQPQHVSRELDRREVGGVLLRGLFRFVSFRSVWVPLFFSSRQGTN